MVDATSQFETHVIAGDQHGRSIGYPTANLAITDAMSSLFQKEGVYAVSVLYNKKSYMGALFWGKRTLFNDTQPVCEVLLIDFNESIYGHTVQVSVHAYVRPTQKVESNEALRAMITEDITHVRHIISKK